MGDVEASDPSSTHAPTEHTTTEEIKHDHSSNEEKDNVKHNQKGDAEGGGEEKEREKKREKEESDSSSSSSDESQEEKEQEKKVKEKKEKGERKEEKNDSDDHECERADPIPRKHSGIKTKKKKDETEEERKVRKEEKEQRKKKEKEEKEERKREKKKEKEERKEEKKKEKEEKKKDKGLTSLIADMKPNAHAHSPKRRSTLASSAIEKEKFELRGSSSSPNMPIAKRKDSVGAEETHHSDGGTLSGRDGKRPKKRTSELFKDLKNSPKKLLHLRSSGDLAAHDPIPSDLSPPTSPGSENHSISASAGDEPVRLKRWKLVSNQEKELMALTSPSGNLTKETLELRYKKMSQEGQFVPMMSPKKSRTSLDDSALGTTPSPASAPSTPEDKHRTRGHTTTHGKVYPTRFPPLPPLPRSPSSDATTTIPSLSVTQSSSGDGVPVVVADESGILQPDTTKDNNNNTHNEDNNNPPTGEEKDNNNQVPNEDSPPPVQITELAIGPLHVALKSVNTSGMFFLFLSFLLFFKLNLKTAFLFVVCFRYFDFGTW